MTIEIQPQDLKTLYPFFFAASSEGNSNNETFNRMFFELDKHVRKQEGSGYASYTTILRQEINKQKSKS